MKTRALFALAVVLVTTVLSVGHLYRTDSLGTFMPLSGLKYTINQYRPPDIRDAENLHLTTEQCNHRYPDLYYEADRAREYFRGGISEAMVDAAEKDEANARVAIINNKLYVKFFQGSHHSRAQAAIASLYRTLLTSPEPLPDVDLVLQTSDAGGGPHPHFVLDRRADQPHFWLIPDFGFFSWPEPGVGAYTEVRDKAREYEERLGLSINGSTVVSSSWDAKTDKLMWRGVPMVEVRNELVRASENQPWSDVKVIDWGKVNDENEKDNGGDLKTPEEHCQYQFLAHTEGWAYSGRLKYLLQCRSVVVTHDLEYIQHFHHLLIADPQNPKQNIVEVKRPLEEHLPGVMEQLTDPVNTEWMQRVADNSWNDLREGYISPAANECYFRYALRAYASVQTFRPKIGDGVPYESFLLTGTTHWLPHR